MNQNETLGTFNDAPCVCSIDDLRNDAIKLMLSMTDDEIMKTLRLMEKDYQ